MTLSIRNRQRVRRVNATLLRRITLHALREQLQITDYELAIHLVAAPEMARVNWDFLKHEGSTDVITFDHSDQVGQASRLSRTSSGHLNVSNAPANPDDLENRDRRDACPTLHGEIFICLDDAVKQAREFQTTWQSELVRYVIHGLLHLHGHDDLRPAARRLMKREENRLLKATAAQFPISKLGLLAVRRKSQSAFRNPHSAI